MKTPSIDYEIHYQDAFGFINSKEKPPELVELSEYLNAFPTTGRLRNGKVGVVIGGLALLTAACAVTLPSTENPNMTPTLGPDNGFGVIPTVEALPNGTFPTETYCSLDFDVCALHQFNGKGEALAPIVKIDAELVFDLDNNRVVVTGDNFIDSPSAGDFVSYAESNGQEGYRKIETKTVEEMSAWMEGMDLSEADRASMSKVIEDARAQGVDVNVRMKTVLNKKTVDGRDKLDDITLGISMVPESEGAGAGDIQEFNTKLEPLSENSLLEDQQIAAVGFVPQFDGSESLVMEVYPSNWEDNGVQFVSPEWFDQQDKIASSSERFTLMPDGSLQDNATIVPGLSVDKKGQYNLLVNGEKIVLVTNDVSFDDKDGAKIKGYQLDESTGVWQKLPDAAPTPIPPEMGSAITLFNEIGIDPSTYTLTTVDGVMVGTDIATGKEVFRDGKFDLRYAVENATDLMPTKYKPRAESEVGKPNIPPENMAVYFISVYERAMVEFKKSTGLDLYIKGKTGSTNLMLDPDTLSYGITETLDKGDPNSPQYLIYEKSTGEIVIVPVEYSPGEVTDFWSN